MCCMGITGWGYWQHSFCITIDISLWSKYKGLLIGSESGWKGLDEQFLSLHIISQRQQSLPDLQESGKYPTWPVARANCAIVQRIWEENKVALGRTALGGGECVLMDMYWGCRGTIGACISYILAQKPCLMQSKCRFWIRPQPLSPFYLHYFHVTKVIDNYPYIDLSSWCTEVLDTFLFCFFFFSLNLRIRMFISIVS